MQINITFYYRIRMKLDDIIFTLLCDANRTI